MESQLIVEINRNNAATQYTANEIDGCTGFFPVRRTFASAPPYVFTRFLYRETVFCLTVILTFFHGFKTVNYRPQPVPSAKRPPDPPHIPTITVSTGQPVLFFRKLFIFVSMANDAFIPAQIPQRTSQLAEVGATIKYCPPSKIKRLML